MEVNGKEVKISDEVRQVMEERGILAEDIQEVLIYAETGKKLCAEDGKRFLGKKRLEQFTVYVEYALEECIEVLDTYSHRVMMAEDL